MGRQCCPETLSVKAMVWNAGCQNTYVHRYMIRDWYRPLVNGQLGGGYKLTCD